MRAAVQRVSEVCVTVGETVSGAIEAGLLIYLGVASTDDESDVTYLADKVRHLRIFPDASDRLNLDVVQASGKILVVSAFTVQADARRGRRPSFENAAPPKQAKILYERFCEELAELGVPVERGEFQEMMAVRSVNDGPICILLDSRRTF